MNSHKIGRNDPCPCGSGKKYKNCCLGLDEATDQDLDRFERYNQLLMTVKVKLDGQYGSEIKKIRRAAQENFLRFAGLTDIPSDHASLFSDWLWFDFPAENAISLAQQYYTENGNFMYRPLAECLLELNHSFLSILVPLEAGDASFLLHDLITGTTRRVMLKEPWEIEENLSNIILLGRIVETAGGGLFSGMVLMQKNDAGQREFIRRNLDYFKSLAGLTATDFCRQYGEIVYGVFCHALNKTSLNLNDIKAFSLEAPLSDIDRNNNILPLYQAGGWQWFKPAHCSGYARIALKDHTVLIATDRAEDLPVISSWLNQFKNIAVKNICNLLQSPDIEQAPLWFAVMKDRETEKWLHTPHHELDGQTPEEVLREENGRRQLLNLLDTLVEESEQSEEEKELLLFMRERIQGINPL